MYRMHDGVGYSTLSCRSRSRKSFWPCWRRCKPLTTIRWPNLTGNAVWHSMMIIHRFRSLGLHFLLNASPNFSAKFAEYNPPSKNRLVVLSLKLLWAKSFALRSVYVFLIFAERSLPISHEVLSRRHLLAASAVGAATLSVLAMADSLKVRTGDSPMERMFD